MKIMELIKKNNIIILFFLALIFMTVGFATYNQILNFSGSVTLEPNGKIEILSVTKSTHTNATSDPQIINDNTEIDFNLSFTTVDNQDNIAEFDVTIYNNTFDDCVFYMPIESPIVSSSTSSSDSNYESNVGWKFVDSEGNSVIGNKIPTKTEMSFKIIFTFINPSSTGDTGNTYEISGNFIPNVTTDETATLKGDVSNSATADLRGTNETALCKIDVINSYSTDQRFTLAVKDTDKFAIQYKDDVDYTIAANSEQSFEFYLTKVEGSEYPYESTYVRIYLENQGVTSDAGALTALVDKNITIEDTTPPTIRNVTATIGDTSGTVNVSWEGEDDVSIQSFTVYAYKADDAGTFSKVEFADGDITVEAKYNTVLIEALTEGTYYFTVFGTDSSNNTPDSSTIEAATTAEGYASRCENIALDWIYSVTVNISNCNYSGAGTDVVKRNETCTVTFTKDSSVYFWDIPTNTPTVTMGGETCTNLDYDSTTGVLTIPNVTGDIVVTAEASFGCLAEGTKILLADGTYKNIEDIEYTDLLAVYDHLNGGITYVYPVWIEKVGVTSKYQKITFNDGTFIKVVGQHCLFDSEKNRYVDVSNSEEFGIGSKVYKIENNELKVVVATKIEYINETINYYDILSTTHYNVIANDLITTDKITQLSNVLYGFKENAVFANWDKVINSEQIEYKDASFFSYDVFKGCNFNNTLFLAENNYLDLKALASFLVSSGKEQTTINSDKYFMVTTSDDEVNLLNADSYLRKEGSIYTFPKIGAKYFIDTATNKMYKEGETFTVYNSTHFKVVY